MSTCQCLWAHNGCSKPVPCRFGFRSSNLARLRREARGTRWQRAGGDDAVVETLRRYLEGGEITLTPERFRRTRDLRGPRRVPAARAPERKCSNALRELSRKALSSCSCAGAI